MDKDIKRLFASITKHGKITKFVDELFKADKQMCVKFLNMVPQYILKAYQGEKENNKRHKAQFYNFNVDYLELADFSESNKEYLNQIQQYNQQRKGTLSSSNDNEINSERSSGKQTHDIMGKMLHQFAMVQNADGSL